MKILSRLEFKLEFLFFTIKIKTDQKISGRKIFFEGNYRIYLCKLR